MIEKIRSGKVVRRLLHTDDVKLWNIEAGANRPRVELQQFQDGLLLLNSGDWKYEAPDCMGSCMIIPV